MSINLTDEIEVKTKKGKLCAAKQIFLKGDTKNVENEIQDINSRHNTLNTKHESLSRTVQGIAATSGASTANNVTYNNNNSGLNAENVQDAIDELSSIGHFAKRGGIVNISTNYNSEHTAEVLTLAQALSKVPSTDRVLGFQGKYLASDGWHTIIYTGNSLTSWSDTTKWIDLADKVFNSISNNATFAGIATPATNPGTPDGLVFYLAGISGVYSNFGVTLQDEIAVIANTGNNSWVKHTVLGVATTKSAGVMTAKDKIDLNLVLDNDIATYLNAIISSKGDIIKDTSYTNRTFVTRYTVNSGMRIQGYLDLIPFGNTSTWANLVLLDESGNFSRVMTYTDFNNTGLTVNENEKFLCVTNPCKIGSYIKITLGDDSKTIRLDDSATLQSFRDLGDITSSQFINSTYIYNNELSSLPEDTFIKSDLDFEVIEGAYIGLNGMIEKGDFGNIIIIKPKSSTQYIHIKSRLSGRNICFLGYSNTVSAKTVKPLISTTSGADEVINADWYIKPVTYLYVYVGGNAPTLESIDGFNLVPVPTIKQVSDITSDITSVFRILPLLQNTLSFTYKNGYIEGSGMVIINNDFNNSLAVFDLAGLSRVKIKVKSVVNETYTTASFSNSITPTSSSTFLPIIKTPKDVVTEIVTDVVNRYLFVYVNNASVSELEVSKISVAPTELVSKNELLKIENNITSSLTNKLDKKFGDNLFDKDSPEILYDTLLSTKNVIEQPFYAKNFCVTQYIAIEEGKNYIANYSSEDNSISLCVVDATRTTVLLSINKETGPEYKFTAPEGAAYVRMTIPTQIKDTFIFNEGTEVIEESYYEDKPVFHSEFNIVKTNATVYPWKNKVIAMYGDSITELCGNDTVGPTSWGGYLISALNAKGIVRGWGGTTLIHNIWNNSSPGINIHWFNDFGEQVAVGTEGAVQCNPVGMCDWKRIVTQFPETIKDTINAVILMGGTNDFRSSEIGNIEYTLRDSIPEVTTNIDTDWIESEYYTGGDFDVTKVQGAVCSAILKLQTWMPNAVIIVATQLSGIWLTQGENGTHQLVSDKSGLTEGEFALKIAEAARYMSVPVIDINGLTGINQWNRTRFITDNVHPYTNNGNKAMARVFIGEMTRIRPNTI